MKPRQNASSGGSLRAPPKSIGNREQRLIISKLALDLLRLNYEAIFTGEPFGMRAADGLLLTAVFVGHAEGKPMTAGKLAIYAGMPRPTAVRRLAALQREGLVVRTPGRSYLLAVERFTSDGFGAVVKASAQMIIRAGLALSKMDS